MTPRRYALRDDQWDRIQDLLPGRPGYVGVTARDIVLVFISQIFHWNKNHNNLSLNTEDFLAIKLGEIL